MRVARLLPIVLCALLAGCSSSVVGTGAPLDDSSNDVVPGTETGDDRSADPSASISETANGRGSADGSTSSGDDVEPTWSATMTVDGEVFDIAKAEAAILEDGVVSVALWNVVDAYAPHAFIHASVTGGGCDVGDRWVGWYPEGGVGDVPRYESSRAASCGLTVSRVDRTVGGRVAGSFHGVVTLLDLSPPPSPAAPKTVQISVTFNVPVTEKL